VREEHGDNGKEGEHDADHPTSRDDDSLPSKIIGTVLGDGIMEEEIALGAVVDEQNSLGWRYIAYPFASL
jgi:hypothetical protein